nr:hypothetical protein CKG001_10570 [Bdellovibrio sp. CKG001]
MTKLEERLNQAADQIVRKLDEKGREYDVCDFGLPVADDGEMSKMTAMVRDEIKSLFLELPELKALVEGLESYASGDHFVYHGNEDHAPDSVSGEPPNIMFGGAEGSEFQFEDGSWAKKKLDQWRSFIGDESNSSEIPNSSEQICRDCNGNGYTDPPNWTVKCKRCDDKGLL